MLLKGGAESVVGIAFAKYRNTHNIAAINGDWDPFTPFNLDADQISTTEYHGTFNQTADDYFLNIIWRAAQS